MVNKPYHCDKNRNHKENKTNIFNANRQGMNCLKSTALRLGIVPISTINVFSGS